MCIYMYTYYILMYIYIYRDIAIVALTGSIVTLRHRLFTLHVTRRDSP